MSENLIKIAALGISFLGILIALYKVNQTSLARSIENQVNIVNIEKDLLKMKKEHERDSERLEGLISDVEVSVKEMKNNNRNDHAKLFDELKEVAKGVAEITGYLKAKIA